MQLYLLCPQRQRGLTLFSIGFGLLFTFLDSFALTWNRDIIPTQDLSLTDRTKQFVTSAINIAVMLGPNKQLNAGLFVLFVKKFKEIGFPVVRPASTKRRTWRLCLF
jgi:hypothetical protein